MLGRFFLEKCFGQKRFEVEAQACGYSGYSLTKANLIGGSIQGSIEPYLQHPQTHSYDHTLCFPIDVTSLVPHPYYQCICDKTFL